MGHLNRGRVIAARDASTSVRPMSSPPNSPYPSTRRAEALGDADTAKRGHVASRDVIEADQRAKSILEHARIDAERIVAGARAEAHRLTASIREELVREADARVAAALLAVRAEDEALAERSRQRIIDTAVVIAERVVSGELATDPGIIARMATLALREARGARRVTFEANPLDAAALRAQLETLGLPEDAVSIEPRDDLTRGDLVLRTDLGTLDARLKPQLQRLADALSRAGRPR